jgi:hypothetical protein
MAVSPNHTPACSGRVKWLSDLDKFVLVSNFEKRGWIKGSSEGLIQLTTPSLVYTSN